MYRIHTLGTLGAEGTVTSGWRAGQLGGSGSSSPSEAASNTNRPAGGFATY